MIKLVIVVLAFNGLIFAIPMIATFKDVLMEKMGRQTIVDRSEMTKIVLGDDEDE